jgi:NAD(P)-dependent dehydrogenase (short-subunit alcohol dehydrogenase family)
VQTRQHAIGALGGPIEVVRVALDVTDEASVDALFAQVPDVNGARRPRPPCHASGSSRAQC